MPSASVLSTALVTSAAVESGTFLSSPEPGKRRITWHQALPTRTTTTTTITQNNTTEAIPMKGAVVLQSHQLNPFYNWQPAPARIHHRADIISDYGRAGSCPWTSFQAKRVEQGKGEAGRMVGALSVRGSGLPCARKEVRIVPEEGVVNSKEVKAQRWRRKCREREWRSEYQYAERGGRLESGDEDDGKEDEDEKGSIGSVKMPQGEESVFVRLGEGVVRECTRKPEEEKGRKRDVCDGRVLQERKTEAAHTTKSDGSGEQIKTEDEDLMFVFEL